MWFGRPLADGYPRHRGFLAIALLWGLAVMAAAPAGALASALSPDTNPTSELDELLEQFDEAPASSPGSPAAGTPPPDAADRTPLSRYISGELSLVAAWNIAHDPPPPGQTDWRGLSMLRARLAVEIEADVTDHLELRASGYAFYDAAYAINGRDAYTADVLDAYEQDLELTETYALFTPISSVDFRFGRQIVVWGASENLRVTDVLNPLDLREPGMTDLEYIRMPVTMSRIDYFRDGWQLSAVAIHEIRFNKMPVYGSDYYPYAAPLPPEDKPSNGGADTEWALSVGRTFSGWDLAVYYADHFDDAAYLAAGPTGVGTAMERRHARLNMVGGAANLVMGNWLFKAEAARQTGYTFTNAPGDTFGRLDTLAGLEYSGFHETTISVEVASRRIAGFDDRLRAPPDAAQPESFQSALRITREFMNDTLTCTLLAMTYGPVGQDGAFQRLQAEYDLSDHIEITGGAVFYQSGDLPEFQAMGDSNRIFAEIAYHF